MYTWYAELDHLPSILMVASLSPWAAAAVAATSRETTADGGPTMAALAAETASIAAEVEADTDPEQWP